ncbi:MAG: M23 family peptidase, partial [Proteobacteria bacterium]|nr:M23 family peptidase [Pseudomonadota bacterium]
MSYQAYPLHDANAQRRDHGRNAPLAAVKAHAAHASARAIAAAYTLGHGRHQVRVGPVAFWTIVGTLVVMGGWSVVTATYFAFHDDVLTRLIARQSETQFAYEDRIAELRAQIDRVTSRQLLDQEQFERKLDSLLSRQSTLESRAASIGALADPTTTGSLPAPGRAAGAARPAAIPPKPSPISDTIIFTAPPDREARLHSRAPMHFARHQAARAARGGVGGMIARFQDLLERAETNQMKALGAIEERL